MQNRRLQQLQNTLNKLYGVRIDFENASEGDLLEAYEAASAEKNRIISESQFNNYHRDPIYSQHILIMEAIRIYLREIAPKRMRRRVKESAKPVTATAKIKESEDMSSKKLLEKKQELMKKLKMLEEQKNKLIAAKKAANKGKGKKVVESSDRLSVLLENDLDQAEVLLAAKDLSSELQKMIEKVASMQVQELMPLVDKMREVFSPEQASQFDNGAKEKLQSAIETLKGAKDGLESEILRLEGKLTGEMGNDMAGGGDDAAAAPGADGGDAGLDAAGANGGDAAAPGADGGDAGGDTGEGLEDLGDEFGGSDAVAGPEQEPVGRAKKESARPTKRMLEGKNVKKKSSVTEGKDQFGDVEYSSYAKWRANCKTAGAVKFDGDKDICTALNADNKGVGEWDGEKGTVYDNAHKAAKKKAAENVDESLVLPPELITVFEDFEYYVKRRRTSLSEAKKAVLSRFKKLRESTTDTVMVSMSKMEEALDGYIQQNRERLIRIVSLNGLKMPKELAEAISAVGLTEDDFRSTLHEYFDETKKSITDEQRYGEFVTKIAEQTAEKPKVVAAWVAKMIESKAVAELSGESYGTFVQRVRDAQRNLQEGASLDLNENERDVWTISAMHESVISDGGFVKWFANGAMDVFKKVTESVGKIEGKSKLGVLSILKKFEGVISEHADKHGRVDDFGVDKLAQLDAAYTKAQKAFESDMALHLSRKRISEGK